MRIAVLGSTGMAGHVIAQYLEEKGHEVYRVSRSEQKTEYRAAIDVTDFQTLDVWLDQCSPDAIVNCIGLLQRACEERPDLGILINSYFPRRLEQKYKRTRKKIIHLSTDCVFSGARGGYKEDDLPDGATLYDRSKAMGELQNNKDITFRMSIVGPDINPKGTGLFNWFMAQDGKIDGFGKVYWNGVTTIELARAIDAALKQEIAGLFHLVPSGNIDKCSLLSLFQGTFGKENVTIHRVEEPVVDKSLINTRQDFNFAVRDYPAQIEDMCRWMDTHRAFYPHYFEP